MQQFIVRTGYTTLYFGPNSISRVSEKLSRYRRVYIVTSRSAAKSSGALDDVLEAANRYRIAYEIFDKVSPNPLEDTVEELAANIWRFGAEAVIAIGGGSVIDSAKVSSVIAKCGGRVADYIQGLREYCGSIPVIAVNITHGTGSEVNRYAVITLKNPRTKYGLANESMYPSISIDDPRYTITLPQNQTVYTSLDAMYHVLEASCGKDSSPYVLTIAEEAFRKIVEWLPTAVKDLKNLEARYWLLYASMLGGISIDHSRAHMIHAIENVLSGMNTALPHGAGLAMLGPTAIKYLYRARPRELYRLIRYLDPEIKPDEAYAERASKAIDEFQKMVGFRERLSSYGFKSDDVEKAVETALKYLSYGFRLAPIEVSKEMLIEIVSSSL